MEQFSHFANYVHDIVLLCDVNGTIHEVNQAAVTAYGYSKQEFAGLHVIHLRNEVEAELVHGQLEKARSGGTLFETMHRRRDGTVFPVEVKSHGVQLQGREYLISVVRDLSERKQAAAEIARQNRYLATLNETAIDLMNHMKLHDLLAKVVQRACSMVGAANGCVFLFHAEQQMMKLEIVQGEGLQTILQHRQWRRAEGAVGWIWQNAQAITVENYATWPQRMLEAEFDKVKSFVGVPLLAGERVIGVLALVHMLGEGRFTISDQEALLRLGRVTAVAIESARLHDSLQAELTERARTEAALRHSEVYNNMLREVTLRLLEGEAGRPVTSFICQQLVEMFGLLLVWVGIKETDGRVRVEAAAGTAIGYIEDIEVRWDAGPTAGGPGGSALQSGLTQVTDVTGAGFAPWRERAQRYAIGGVAVFPLKVKGVPVGILSLYARDVEIFSEKLISQLERFVGQIAMSIDIAAERRRLQVLSTAVRSAANAIMVTDASGKIEWVNPAFVALTGYTEAEVCGKLPLMLQSSQHAEDFYLAFLQTVRSGRVWRGEIISRRKSGEEYIGEMTVTPVKDENGSIINYIAVKQDISDRKAAERKVAQSLEYYVQLLENFPSLIWRAGTDGMCNYFNRKWLEFRGRTLEEEANNGWVEGVHPEDKDFCLATYQTHFTQKMGFEMEYRLQRYDGEYRWIVDVGRPYYDLDGQFAGYIGTCYDSTDMRQAQQAMMEARHRAERAERLASLGTMAAGIAHEINQPLNSLKVIIDGILYWHRRGRVIDMERLMQQLSKVSDQAGRIDNIIRHMRSFVRVDGQQELVICDMNQVIRDALDFLGLQLQGRGIVVHMALADGLPGILGRHRRLEEVIINVLVNAMQELVAANVMHKTIWLQTEQCGAVVRVLIRDNGRGIAEDVQTRIFEPFFTTKDTGVGMGLGLPIAHTVVTSFNGQISVSNHPAGGAVFCIEFPVA